MGKGFIQQIEHYQYLDTYANLLYKAGRVNEAISTQKRAVNLSNGNELLKQTLEKMERGEKT